MFQGFQPRALLFPNERQALVSGARLSRIARVWSAWKFYTGATLHKSVELIWNILCATPTGRVLCRAESRTRDGFRTRRGTVALSTILSGWKAFRMMSRAGSLCSQDSDARSRPVGSLALLLFPATILESTVGNELAVLTVVSDGPDFVGIAGEVRRVNSRRRRRF